ncbi:MAG: hypothetical protein QM770_18775 [Tepidisphaeraceae bacterium]
MRLSLAWGLLAILWLSVSTGLAQVSGRVESIGFDSLYRPTCWTPLLVKLKLDSGTSGTFELRVTQHDENGDFVLYTTRVTLTGGVGEQPFWTYFIPQPVLHGLRVASIDELQDVLRVSVHDASGKELAVLPVPKSLPRDVDPDFDINNPVPGRKLILFVGDNSAVATEEFRQDKIVGTSESFEAAKVSIDRLPENVLGYDAVDAIVWLDGDPGKLRDGGSTRFDALREFVRRGGHLVVCTNKQWQPLANFGDLLPVDVTDVQALTTLDALKALATQTNRWKPPRDENNSVIRGAVNTWSNATGPIATARANPKPGVIVETPLRDNALRTLDWGNNVRTPWLVRRGFGYGCVSFVAQDLGDVNLVRSNGRAWMLIWDTVLGTNNSTIVNPTRRSRFSEGSSTDQFRWGAEGMKDFGFTLLRYLDLTGRSATLVVVAVFFFIGYWIIAGPGVYLFLRAKRKQQYSWFAFGALTVLATLLTLGVVRLMLSGPPQVRHISFVRAGPVDPAAIVVSRIGLYVPKDGAQQLTLDPGDGAFTRTLTPFPRSPDTGWTSDQLMVKAPRSYTVDVSHAVAAADASSEPTKTSVEFRRTQKQFMARWAGGVQDRLSGDVRAEDGKVYVSGQLVNVTNQTFRNVYFAFRGANGDDALMFVPEWKAGDTLDLADLWQNGDKTALIDPNSKLKHLDISDVADPGRGVFLRGSFQDWAQVWLNIRGGALSSGDRRYDDFDATIPRTLPVLSLFGRLPPRNPLSNENRRVEILRTGARDLDVSNALLAGNLVVIAQADDQPLPLPFKVEGRTPDGAGRVLYQFVMPIDRSAVTARLLKPPTTQP